jgi:glutaryl-CoA dehydrogenase
MATRTDNFVSPDYFKVDELLSEEQKHIRDAVRSYVKKEISPIIEDYAQRAEFPQQIIKQLGDLGCFGPTVPVKYGGGGLDYISYGLMMQELERGDSGVRSTASVQGSLVMFPIYEYGNEEQRNKYLPKLASGEWLGCFGLTEPNHGSDPSSMTTNFKDAGDHVILNGAKMWISNAPFSQVAVVWAKGDDGEIQGLIVERGMEGFTTPTTHGKWSLRASATGELVFDNVKVPKQNILPNIKGLKGPLGCLTKARYGISWGTIGAAMDCYDTALRYSKERIQFDKPIGAFQLQQKKLAEMITEITKAQLLNWRLGVLMNEGKATPQQVSMAKRNSCEVAANACRDARQMLEEWALRGSIPLCGT